MLNFFFCHIYYWRPLIQLWNFNTKRPMSSLSDLKYSTWGFYQNFFIVELNLPNCFQCEIFYDKLIFLLVDFCFSWLDVYFFGKNGWLYIIILKIKLIRKLYQTNIYKTGSSGFKIRYTWTTSVNAQKLTHKSTNSSTG